MNTIVKTHWTPILSAIEASINGRLNGEGQASRRLFHGRGGCFPGLEWCAVDDYFPTLLVTLFHPPPMDFLSDLTAYIQTRLASDKMQQVWQNIVVHHRYDKPLKIEWLLGRHPGSAVARRGQQRFHVRFDRQNTGFFLDVEVGRRWLEQRSADRNVLNLFSYTCAFSVVATQARASKVVNVDMSRSALHQGRMNHHLNNLSTDKVDFLPLDILKSWSRIRKRGPYDVIIVDPPSFQKGSFIASRDYVKVIKRLHELASSNCDVLLCLNAPELDAGFLKELMTLNMPQWSLQQRLELPEEFCDLDENKKLKLLHYSNLGQP